MTEQPESIALPNPPPKDVGAAVAWVMSQVGYVQKTTSGNLNYSFASESALIAALRPPMVAAGLVLHVAQLLELRQDTFETKNKAVMNRATVLGIVRLTHTPSATTLDVAACGEGMDVGDKSVNKAMTGMLKYALRQTFLIETGDDPDGSHPEVTGRKPAHSEARPRPVTPPPAAPAAAPAARAQHAWDDAAISEAKRLMPADTPIERVVGILNLSPYTPKDPLPKTLGWVRIYVSMRPTDKTAKKDAAFTAERATVEHQRLQADVPF
jgi:hypothetical protein